MSINENAAFDKNNAACLQETSDDHVGLELYRCWRNREIFYDLTMFFRDDDMTVTVSREELKKLGRTLIRLADATFLEPAHPENAQ
jgi:hypothetical protein